VSQKSIFIVLALGRGYRVDATGKPIDICSAGQCRADRAAEIAASLGLSGDWVYLAATAGRESSRREGPTLATLTVQYWRKHKKDYPYIVNETDHEIWGTLNELVWLENYIKRNFGGKQVYVCVIAAPRQHKRVLRMQTWFGFVPTLQMRVMKTNERPIPLYHEALGYIKLSLIKAGLGRYAEWFRRVTARPIKE